MSRQRNPHGAVMRVPGLRAYRRVQVAANASRPDPRLLDLDNLDAPVSAPPAGMQVGAIRELESLDAGQPIDMLLPAPARMPAQREALQWLRDRGVSKVRVAADDTIIEILRYR